MKGIPVFVVSPGLVQWMSQATKSIVAIQTLILHKRTTLLSMAALLTDMSPERYHKSDAFFMKAKKF
jgi:hypothetical protein